MKFEDFKKDIIQILEDYLEEIKETDEEENETEFIETHEYVTQDGYSYIAELLDELEQEIDYKFDEALIEIPDEEFDDEFEDELDDEFDDEFDDNYYDDFEEDYCDELEDYLNELHLLNETIRVYDYDPVKNGILIENINIEPSFGGIQVMGEVTKVNNHENNAGLVSVNVVLYHYDESDDSIMVLRKELYDIDLDSIDNYDVFVVDIGIDPYTLERVSGVNVYLTR